MAGAAANSSPDSIPPRGTPPSRSSSPPRAARRSSRTRRALIFLAKDKDGQTPRIVGDFNGWAVTPQGYDVSIGKTTRIDGTSWSYLEGTSYTNARLEYGLLFDKEYTPDPKNPRTVQAFAGPRSEVRMPFFDGAAGGR